MTSGATDISLDGSRTMAGNEENEISETERRLESEFFSRSIRRRR